MRSRAPRGEDDSLKRQLRTPDCSNGRSRRSDVRSRWPPSDACRWWDSSGTIEVVFRSRPSAPATSGCVDARSASRHHPGVNDGTDGSCTHRHRQRQPHGAVVMAASVMVHPRHARRVPQTAVGPPRPGLRRQGLTVGTRPRAQIADRGPSRSRRRPSPRPARARCAARGDAARTAAAGRPASRPSRAVRGPPAPGNVQQQLSFSLQPWVRASPCRGVVPQRWQDARQGNEVPPEYPGAPSTGSKNDRTPALAGV